MRPEGSLICIPDTPWVVGFFSSALVKNLSRESDDPGGSNGELHLHSNILRRFDAEPTLKYHQSRI